MRGFSSSRVGSSHRKAFTRRRQEDPTHRQCKSTHATVVQATQGQRHRHIGGHPSGRRLFDRRLRFGRNRSCSMAQFDRRYGYRREISRPGAKRGPQVAGGGSRRSTGCTNSSSPCKGLEHRSVAHRRPWFLGRWGRSRKDNSFERSTVCSCGYHRRPISST